MQTTFRDQTTTFKSRPIRLVLLGGPGAGKGTQSELIKEHYNVRHLSTGDLLRAEVAAQTELGKTVGALMSQGKLVDDANMMAIIRSQLSTFNANEGFILDGFPRTTAQAEFLNELLNELRMPLTGVINFDVDDETIVKRVCGRWIHKSSGRSYHEIYMKPRRMDTDPITDKVVKAYDDNTGDELMKRADDNESSIRSRLAAYHEYSKPLIGYYQEMPGSLFLNIEAYDKFETWTIVQLALGEHDRETVEVPTIQAPTVTSSISNPLAAKNAVREVKVSNNIRTV